VIRLIGTVLSEIKTKQNQHGLKHGDYNRYRTYCSQRLQRLRRSLKQNTGRSKTMYLKRVLNQVVVESLGVKKEPERYLMIPLFSAERAWSYAMALKQEGDTRKRYHMIRRFQKAVAYAKNLESLCNEEPTVCDVRTKLESQAYAAFIEGLYLFEREQWAEATEQLKKTQAIYSKLVESVPDQPESIEVYTQRINELKPTLRYCAFNLNEKGASDSIEKFKTDDIQDEFLAKKLDDLLMQERGKKSAKLTEVTWLGKKIAVSKDLIRLFLVDIEAVLEFPPGKMNTLEKKLFESRDCLQSLKELGQDKGMLYTYISYIRQRLTYNRNIELIKSVKNDTEKVRPCETIISALTKIEALPIETQFGDSAEVRDLIAELEGQMLAFKAFRCYYIACTGWLDWKKSIAMLNRCCQYADSAVRSKISESLQLEVQDLGKQAESSQYKLYSENAEDNQNDPKSNSVFVHDRRLLIDDLDRFVKPEEIGRLPKLTHLPPKYEPVPFKPFFFDLAHNHIAFPSLDEEMGINKKNDGAGISNLVKGWFWKK
jgi:signal recognition particle subunit SRP68